MSQTFVSCVMFVSCLGAFRLAKAAVVRRRVQTPFQTPARLVPTHQGRQPGHRLHRGNTQRSVSPPRRWNVSTRVVSVFHFHVNGNQWLLHDFWIGIRLQPLDVSLFPCRSMPPSRLVDLNLTWRPFKLQGCNYKVAVGIEKGWKGKWWRWRLKNDRPSVFIWERRMKLLCL